MADSNLIVLCVCVVYGGGTRSRSFVLLLCLCLVENVTTGNRDVSHGQLSKNYSGLNLQQNLYKCAIRRYKTSDNKNHTINCFRTNC